MFTEGNDSSARSTDPDTSHEAAEGSQGREDLGVTVLRALEETGPDGMTSDEVAMALGILDQPYLCWWRRITDLIDNGMAADTGNRRPGLSGRRQRVVAITAKGLDYLAGGASAPWRTPPSQRGAHVA